MSAVRTGGTRGNRSEKPEQPISWQDWFTSACQEQKFQLQPTEKTNKQIKR